jgi:hypothetical protein
MPIVNNHPMGENSPNLVTLLGTHDDIFKNGKHTALKFAPSFCTR